MDLRMATNWAAQWSALVEARAAQMSLSPHAGAGFWDRAAATFPTTLEPGEDRLVETVAPWLDGNSSVIDVGAGVGRHVNALLGLVDWVTAVEPSEAMRARLPAAPNLTVIASGWLEADPAPADVVICSHVMHSVTEVEPFLRHLDAAARRRVAIQDRASSALFPWDALFERITGEPRRREPLLADLYLVLDQMGISPDVTTYRRPARWRYRDAEAALEDLRFRTGAHFQEAAARAFVSETMREDADGALIYEPGQVTVGVLHWTPAG